MREQRKELVLAAVCPRNATSARRLPSTSKTDPHHFVIVPLASRMASARASCQRYVPSARRSRYSASKGAPSPACVSPQVQRRRDVVRMQERKIATAKERVETCTAAVGGAG